MRFQAAQRNAAVKVQEEDKCLAGQNNTGLRSSRGAPCRVLKRASPYCSSLLEANTESAKKIRALEKENRRHQVLPAHLKKVDALAYQRENLGEIYMHDSFNTTTNVYNNELDGGELDGFINDSSDIDACSVGSCSATSKPLDKFSTCFLASPYQETNSLSSDAESYSGPRKDEKFVLPPKEVIAANIHSLELHAYQSTLEALYASGPLSWEKEELLTNLRITLHISDDEHLIKLKNLISSKYY